MTIFKKIKKWFSFPEYQDSLAKLIAYLPVGRVDLLLEWALVWIPYKRDLDAQRNYDPLQNYNGADLTIKAKSGDCESIAAVFKEVISSPEWTARGWAAEHVCFVFPNPDKPREYLGHDVCFFIGEEGGSGWIDGKIYYGDYSDMRKFYDSIGWHITDWWLVNDMGEHLTEL